MDQLSYFHNVTSGNNTWSKSPSLFYAMNNYDLCTGLDTMTGHDHMFDTALDNWERRYICADTAKELRNFKRIFAHERTAL
jgi:hypothetical protein